MKTILVLSDNLVLLRRFQKLAADVAGADWHYGFSPSNKAFLEMFRDDTAFRPICVKSETDRLRGQFDTIISLHCKQIFPPALVSDVKCINIHPGLNPHNRGWYPQVFSILNKLPAGATIHEIDDQLDHGPIIDQQEVPVYEWDTSLSVYERVLDAETHLIEKNLPSIIAGTYTTRHAGQEGGVNLRRDFDALRQFDPDERGSFREFYDRLRALSHGTHRNAFLVGKNGERIFFRLEIEREGGGQ